MTVVSSRPSLASLASVGPTLALGMLGGAAAWSITEYAVHRWVLHGPFGKGRLRKIPIGTVHRTHHRLPDRTVLAARVAGHTAMAIAGVAAGSGLTRIMNPLVARSAATVWSAGYSTYDIVHWRLHHRPPTSLRGVELRQRHFRHHFGAPRRNLGVLTSFWDRALGTEDASGRVRVPTSHAPNWLDYLGPDFVIGNG